MAVLIRHLDGDVLPVPEAGVLLWNLFMEISTTRTWHAAGPHPIANAEIEAWCRLHRWPLQPHHITIIRALDDAWIEHVYGRRAGAATVGASGAQAKPLTSTMFDAAFG